ncbi:hypothetical protein VT98_14253, partial [Candidatus Electrothrix communis]
MLQGRQRLTDEVQSPLGLGQLFPKSKFILIQLRKDQITIKPLLNNLAQGTAIKLKKTVPFICLGSGQIGHHKGLITRICQKE